MCVALVCLGQLPDELGARDGDVDDARHVLLEHHLALQRGGGIVKMDDNVFRALDGVEGLADQMLPGLHQHLDGHVVRNMAALDELPADFIFRFRGGGEADFNFLKAHVAQGLEKLQFLLQVHGIDQRLVAVPQVDAAPDGRFVDDAVRPLPVGKLDLLEGPILLI